MSLNYFKRNKYDRNDIITSFDKLEKIEKVFCLEIPNDRIEIHIEDLTIKLDDIRATIEQIPNFDNFVKDFCEKAFNESTCEYKVYVVELAWIKIELNRVVMGYFGEYVNVELRAIFKKEDIEWVNDAIYYQ